MSEPCNEESLSSEELNEMFPQGQTFNYGMELGAVMPVIVMNWYPAYAVWGAN